MKYFSSFSHRVARSAKNRALSVLAVSSLQLGCILNFSAINAVKSQTVRSADSVKKNHCHLEAVVLPFAMGQSSVLFYMQLNLENEVLL